MQKADTTDHLRPHWIDKRLERDAGRSSDNHPDPATTVSPSSLSEPPFSAHIGAPEAFATLGARSNSKARPRGGRVVGTNCQLRGSGPPTLLTGDNLCCRIGKRSSVEEGGRRGAENHPGSAATVSPSSRRSRPLSPSSAHIIGLDLRRSLLIGSPASLASLGDGDDQTLLTGDDVDGSSSDDAPFGGRVEDMSDLMLLIARLQLPSAQKVQQQREWRADRSQRETGVVRRSSSARGRSVSIDPRPPERIFSSIERAFGTDVTLARSFRCRRKSGAFGNDVNLAMTQALQPLRRLPADPEHLPRAVERSIASRRTTSQPVLTVVSPSLTPPTSPLTDTVSEPDDAEEFFDVEDRPFWMTNTSNAVLGDEVGSYPTSEDIGTTTIVTTQLPELEMKTGLKISTDQQPLEKVGGHVILAADRADGEGGPSSEGVPEVGAGGLERESDPMLLIARVRLPSVQKLQRGRAILVRPSRSMQGRRARSVSFDQRAPEAERIFTSPDDANLAMTQATQRPLRRVPPADPGPGPPVRGRSVCSVSTSAERRTVSQPVVAPTQDSGDHGTSARTMTDPDFLAPTSSLPRTASDTDEPGKFSDVENPPDAVGSEAAALPLPGGVLDSSLSNTNPRRLSMTSTNTVVDDGAGFCPASEREDITELPEKEIKERVIEIPTGDQSAPKMEEHAILVDDRVDVEGGSFSDGGNLAMAQVPQQSPLPYALGREQERVADESPSPMGPRTFAEIFPRSFGRADQEVIQILRQSLREQIAASVVANVETHNRSLELALADVMSEADEFFDVEDDPRPHVAIPVPQQQQPEHSVSLNHQEGQQSEHHSVVFEQESGGEHADSTSGVRRRREGGADLGAYLVYGTLFHGHVLGESDQVDVDAPNTDQTSAGRSSSSLAPGDDRWAVEVDSPAHGNNWNVGRAVWAFLTSCGRRRNRSAVHPPPGHSVDSVVPCSVVGHGQDASTSSVDSTTPPRHIIGAKKTELLKMSPGTRHRFRVFLSGADVGGIAANFGEKSSSGRWSVCPSSSGSYSAQTVSTLVVNHVFQEELAAADAENHAQAESEDDSYGVRCRRRARRHVKNFSVPRLLFAPLWRFLLG